MKISRILNDSIGKSTVRIEEGTSGAVIQTVDIIVNNFKVITLSEKPFYFHLTDLPSGEHWIIKPTGKSLKSSSKRHKNTERR